MGCRSGVEPTQYGRALIKRGLAVFDELRQGIKDVEFLADPTTGELRIGCSESMADTLVAAAIDKLSRQHPRLSFHIETRVGPVFEQLAMRNVELAISRLPAEATDRYMVVEELFTYSYAVAAGPKSRWLRRREIELVELLNEPWTLPPFDSFGSIFIAEAFRANGLSPPKSVATAVSRTMRNRLLATGRFLTMLPGFSVIPDQYPFLRKLPVKLLPDTRAPLQVITIKNRALSPLALLFLKTLRTIAAKSLGKRK